MMKCRQTVLFIRIVVTFLGEVMVKATQAGVQDTNGRSHPAHAETDYFKMEQCLCGCGRTINVKAPWGRFAKGGVYGATCNETYLKKRQESLMTRAS